MDLNIRGPAPLRNPGPHRTGRTDDADDGATATEALAGLLWRHAREEPVRGIEALAAVVLNRAHFAVGETGGSRNKAVAGVCCEMLAAAHVPAKPAVPSGSLAAADARFACCLRVARRALGGLLEDPTGGATRFHGRYDYPEWARDRFPCAEIGNLIFYRDSV